MAIEKEYGRWIPTCDGCGDTLDPCDTFDDALGEMKAAGWGRKFLNNGMGNGEWINLCPTCQEEVKE